MEQSIQKFHYQRNSKILYNLLIIYPLILYPQKSLSSITNNFTLENEPIHSNLLNV